MKTKTSLILTVAALALSGSALAEVKIALVAKSLGNGFFEAANVGAQQAAKELGDVKVIYTGPTTTTAEAQIDVLNGLIAQGVDAIAISANDPDAVVPVLKKAMQRGIKVVSWDSGVSSAGIAASCGTGTSVCTAASLLPGEGHSRRQARSIAASLVRGL